MRRIRTTAFCTRPLCARIVLALGLFLAAGQVLAACGNGAVETGEDCDDGGLNGSTNSCCATDCKWTAKSPDVIVGDIVGALRYGSVGGITAYSVGTTSCNVGSCWLNWFQNTSEHPVIGQNMYRLKAGRFEQIGQSWLKHGFTALAGGVCSSSCNAPPNGSHLGVNCSDPYDAGLNGTQSRLGPKSDVNPFSGVFPYPDARIGTTGDAIFKRLQVHNADLDPAQNAGASYFVEAQYVTRDDAMTGHGANNASYRPVTVGVAPSFQILLTGSTVRRKAGIQAWRANDPSVSEVFAQAPSDGYFVVASKVTSLGGGSYHYEYAVENLTSQRAGRAFSVALPPGTTVANPGFHDVDYHSGEPFSGTDWTVSIDDAEIRWSTDAYEMDANANALRWGTLYNFRFDVNAPPTPGTVTIGMFRPGGADSFLVNTLVPSPCVAVEAACAGGFDEDCDGSFDCADPDCCSASWCATYDGDGDGAPDCGLDCDAGNAAVWATPGEVEDVSLSEADGVTSITWSPPLPPGAVAPRYDTLRSALPGDFELAAECLEIDGLDTASSDPGAPDSGSAWFYLIRCENDCPDGEGPLGAATAPPREARSCP